MPDITLEVRCHHCSRLIGKLANGKLEIAKSGELIARVYGQLIVADCPKCGNSNVLRIPPNEKIEILNGQKHSAH